MEQQTVTPDTPAAVTPAVDTPASSVTVASGATPLDAILKDLTGVPAEPATAPTATTTPPAPTVQTPAPATPAEPNADELLNGDPNLILQRNDYLRRMNAIAAKDAELAAREAAIKAKETGTPAPATPAKPEEQVVTQPAWKPKSADFEFQEPGEKMLAEDLVAMAAQNQALMGLVQKMYEVQTRMAQGVDQLSMTHQETLADQVTTQINSTVTQVKADYGLDVTPEQVAASIQKMGKTILNGSNRLPSDLAIQCWLADPDNRQAYEAALRAGTGGQPSAATPAATAAVTPATPAPAPLRQGGGHVPGAPARSDEADILKDLMAGVQKAS